MGVTTYGPHFAAIYNEDWAFWGRRMWPWLQRQVRRRRPGAAAWLDLCCGAGSLLKHVCAAGYDAAGVDLSAAQLKHARANAPAARLKRADVRTVRLGRQFDVVTSMMDSLNYLTTTAGLLAAFRTARRHLAPGGVFIFDMNTHDGLRRHWNDRDSASLTDTHAMIFRTHFDARTALGTLTITGFVHDSRPGRPRAAWRRFIEHHTERGYRRQEIDRLLARAGLTPLLTCDEWFHRPPSRPDAPEPSRLIYVCKA